MSSRPASSRNPKTKLKSTEDGGAGIWSSMLDSVGSGKRLPEKTVLVLGGTTESQKEFLEAVSPASPQQRRSNERSGKKPPIANKFALGYTYQDILDADHDDVLAHLSIYMLADSHPSFSTLLHPLFNPKTVPNLLIVLLLDWADPWSWLRQLRSWIRILRSVLQQADGDTKEAMEDSMADWQRRRGAAPESPSSREQDGSNVNLPLGPGEWDEPLGVPLCVVCQHAEKIEILEREHSWKDEEFDTVLLYLRTVLLKHGSSLIYTASSAPGDLPTLIRSSLGIESLLQKNPLKHNVIDRDKILVPPNWDSWGKIRVVIEGFDVEGLSNAWSLDVQEPPGAPSPQPPSSDARNGDSAPNGDSSHIASAVTQYDSVIANPTSFHLATAQNGTTTMEEHPPLDTTCPDNQEFLSSQVQILDRLRVEDETAASQRARDALKRTDSSGRQTPQLGALSSAGDSGRISEHIGPVQFNMGGIQVDADDMLRSLREREGGRSSSGGMLSPRSDGRSDARSDGGSVGGMSGGGVDEASFVAGPDGKVENEKLASFFAGLMSRGGGGGGNTSGGSSEVRSPK